MAPAEVSWATGDLGAEAFEQLATTLSGTALQSLLLEVMRRRARARTPAEVVAQYRRDKFVQPALIDQRVAIELDGHLFACAPGFDAIELSPVAPLGTSSSVALSDQHRVLGALRGTEVVSDPTNVLALACVDALRTRDPVHFVTSHRVVRAQPIPDKPGYSHHFRMFALASAGRETVAHGFTVATMIEHVATMQRAFDRLEQHGYTFGARRIEILARADRAQLGDRIAAAVGGERKLLEHPYYSGGLRYMLWVTAPDGREVPLADGGAFDWVAKLSANRRNVFVASGMGAQLVAYAFRR